MNNVRKGILCILGSAFFFATMNIFVRLSGDIPSVQKSFFRNAVAAVFALILLYKNQQDLKYKKKDLPLLIARSSLGTIGILCNFYAVDHLVVSDASMLNKLSPFFVIIFSSLLLKEKANRIQKISVVIAFLGALFVIKPSSDFMSNPASLVAVLGGLAAGIAYTCVRMLGKNGVAGPKIVFFFSAFSSLVVLPWILFHYTPMSVNQVLTLLGAGLSAAGGQFCITYAYTFAPAREISVYDYSQILFSALLGFFILGQIPDMWSILGYVILVSIGVWSFIRQRGVINE